MTSELKRKDDEPRCNRCGRIINRLKSFVKIKGERKRTSYQYEDDKYFHRGCLEVVVYE